MKRLSCWLSSLAGQGTPRSLLSLCPWCWDSMLAPSCLASYGGVGNPNSVLILAQQVTSPKGLRHLQPRASSFFLAFQKKRLTPSPHLPRLNCLICQNIGKTLALSDHQPWRNAVCSKDNDWNCCRRHWMYWPAQNTPVAIGVCHCSACDHWPGSCYLRLSAMLEFALRFRVHPVAAGAFASLWNFPSWC